jgi:thiol:disulfide interchange protein
MCQTSGGRWFLLAAALVLVGIWGWQTLRPMPETRIDWREDVGLAMSESARTGKPLLIVFSADWCAPCRTMKRYAWPDDRVENLAAGRYIPVHVDLTDRKPNSAAERYGVTAIPTIIIADSRGAAIVRGGMMDAATLAAFLEAGLEDAARQDEAMTDQSASSASSSSSTAASSGRALTPTAARA